jgi:hypothetical protein
VRENKKARLIAGLFALVLALQQKALTLSRFLRGRPDVRHPGIPAPRMPVHLSSWTTTKCATSTCATKS